MIPALIAVSLLAAPFDRSWTFDVKASPKVKVGNINGKVEVEASGRQVEVVAHGQEAGDLRAEAVQEGDTINVQICCGDSCGKGSRRGGGRGCNEGKIDLKLTVPAGTDLSVANVSGPIKVVGVTGPQSLANVSGSTRSEGSEGEVSVSTVSGNVELSPRVVADTSLNSVSGDVDLKVPRNASATVKLSSLSGRINGEVGEGGSSKRKIGSGSAQVQASSVSGGVTLSQ